jgi:RING finger and CHY zinc finger domain-containing protein 1
MTEKIIPHEDHLKLGCVHYRRNCQLHAPCCNKFYTCRHCHNENTMDHEMNRHQIDQIKCLSCSTVQKPTNQCSNCQILFGDYHCSICNLYVNYNSIIDIFHCEKCGICRVGKKEETFHCDICGCCIPISKKETHQCVEDFLQKDCPICLEFLFTSTKESQTMKCGHVIHTHCFQEMLESQNYKCPFCNKLVVELDDSKMDKIVESYPMPDELKDLKVNILCNECLKKSECKFHYYGLKCEHCKSYNTARI